MSRSEHATTTILPGHQGGDGRVPASPLSVSACSTGPAGTRPDPETLVTRGTNRWSREGEPTIYLASDPGVALAELGRHWDEQSGDVAVWTVTLELAAAADLRDASVRARLGVPDDPSWIFDVERCQSLASRVREAGTHDGIVVPSVAMLDDPARWNAVVFVDRLPRTLADAVAVEGPVTWIKRPR